MGVPFKDGKVEVTIAESSMDYASRVAARRWDFEAGTGTDEITVPADAWVTGFSFTAGLTDATLVITPDGGSPKPTITVPAGGAYSKELFDTGQLAGATFAFSDAGEFTIDYALEA